MKHKLNGEIADIALMLTAAMPGNYLVYTDADLHRVNNLSSVKHKGAQALSGTFQVATASNITGDRRASATEHFVDSSINGREVRSRHMLQLHWYGGMFDDTDVIYNFDNDKVTVYDASDSYSEPLVLTPTNEQLWRPYILRGMSWVLEELMKPSGNS